MTTNPYTPPTAELAVESEPEDHLQMIGKIVVTWEKLRVVFNVVMGLFVFLIVVGLLLVSSPVSLGPLLAQIIAGGFFANLCFCAGPLAECYLSWFGVRHKFVSSFLFVSGTLFTMIMALFVLLFFPNM